MPDPNYEDWHLYISDSYFFLMPGESKEVEVKTESLKGRLKLVAEGLNL